MIKLVDFPKNDTPETLSENLLELAVAGKVKWMIVGLVDCDGLATFHWSRLPNSFAAVGVAEFLKQTLMDQA